MQSSSWRTVKKPLESALKTFVFFLISQPLIYLLQVPFSAQVVVYLYTFTGTLWQKLLGFFVPLAIVLVVLLVRPSAVQINALRFLPDDPVLTEQAEITVEDSGVAYISVASTGTDSMIRVEATDYGTTSFAILDGEQVYRYTIEIYEDDNRSPHIRITPTS